MLDIDIIIIIFVKVKEIKVLILWNNVCITIYMYPYTNVTMVFHNSSTDQTHASILISYSNYDDYK